MISKGWLCWVGRLGLIVAYLTIPEIITLNPKPALAQLIPDDTLGAESSVVNAIDEFNDRIDGGAVRGANLFQSFLEFNVGEGRGVYFANPDGILNILTRVTGDNPSTIFGRLGVLGNGNLFLLNPNGIVFGENASLDITGSFLATTADAIALGNEGYFSASEPETSSLLSVNPGALFFNQVLNQPGSILNTGNLAAGQDLTLAASNLNIKGQLYAGRDLTLFGLDTVQVRDSLTQPFIAVAEGELLVQGNQNIDIFALNHPNSGFYSGGDMVLRSANQVGGDAHYWSGGGFRIEQLDGKLGDLFSPHDPIIRSLGDVSFNNYYGASLHIFAGGSVTIPGNVFITSADPGNFIAEDITLSDGTGVSIDGSVRPTFDVRAGMNPADVGIPLGVTGINGFFLNLDFTNFELPIISNTATSADILINGIAMFGAPDGIVFITNQYKPNLQLPGGNIEIGDIRTDDITGSFLGNGGSVIINSRNNIEITNSINSSSGSGDAGDIILIANDTTSLINGAVISSDTLGVGKGGNITVTTGQLIVRDGTQVSAGTSGSGDGGSLTVDASESVDLIGISGSSQVLSSLSTPTTATGKGGDLTITTQKLLIENGAILIGTFGVGDGGDLTIDASESIDLIASDQGLSTSGLLIISVGTGNMGDTTITTPNLLIQGGATVSSGAFGSGKGSSLIVNAAEAVKVLGTSADGRIPSSLFTQTNGMGNPGDLTIITPQLLIQDGGLVGSDTFNTGKGGNLIVNAADSVNVIGTSANGQIRSSLVSETYPDAEGDGGNLTITTGQLSVIDGARVSTATFGSGNGGVLEIDTQQLSVQGGAFVQTTTFGSGNAGHLRLNAESVELTGMSADSQISSGLFTQTEGMGSAGDLTITTGKLLVRDGARIQTGTLDSGNAGLLTVNASESVQLIGTSANGEIASGLFTSTEGMGAAGNLTITTGKLLLEDGSQIVAGTVASGDGGNLRVNASESVQLIGRNTDDIFSSGIFTQTTGMGNAGDLAIITPELLIRNGASVSASTLTEAQGNAGDLTINTGRLLVQDGAQLLTSTFGSGNGGSLRVNASESVQVIGRLVDAQISSKLSTQTEGIGEAGDLTIITPQLLLQDGGQVSSGTTDLGNGGTLLINASEFVKLIGTSTDGQISSGLFSQTEGIGEAGNLTITTAQLFVQDGAKVSAATFGSGDGGRLMVNASESVYLSGYSADNRSFSGLVTQTESTGKAGDLTITTGQLFIKDGASVSSGTFGSGNGGTLNVNAAQLVQVIGASADSQFLSSLFTGTASSGEAGDLNLTTPQLLVQDRARVSASSLGSGNGGNLTITTKQVLIQDGAQVGAGTFGAGNGGNLVIDASELVELIGATSNGQIFSGVFTTSEGTGNAGDLTITTPELFLKDYAQVSAATFNQGLGGKVDIQTDVLTLDNRAHITTRAEGQGNAGPIAININGLLTATDSDITTNSTQSAGGAITITADDIRLFGDSDIKTNVFNGAGGGGNITIKADTIIAFDDSDILAFARDGKGGDITLDTDIFFGSSFAFAPKNTDPETLDINDRVDINASGAISGTIIIPDVSFIENSLTELPDNLVDPDRLIANSCIARTTQQSGNFIITGAGGLPVRPNDAQLSPYPTGTVRTIPNDTASANPPPPESWQLGDPIVEPQGVYQLPNGELVMSRDCSVATTTPVHQN